MYTPGDWTQDDVEKIAHYESQVRYYSRHFHDIFVRASGSEVFNQAGRRFIDFFNGAGALNYGHNHPVFKDAMIDYIKNDYIIHSLDIHTPPHIDFLNDFHRIILEKRQLDYKIQFTGPTGANAVEAALKLARKYTQRKTIVYFQGAYHGVSLGALSVTESDKRKKALPITFPDTIMFPYDHPENSESACHRLIQHIDTLAQHDLPAAFIVETTQGEGGVNVASTSWLQCLSEIAKKRGIVLILDDIQAGCGRTGSFFSFERAALSPDIVCLSKSISGTGLPLALLLLKPHIDVWEPGEHNGTFRSNNLALVTARIALNFWTTDALSIEIEKKAAHARAVLQRFVTQYPHTGATVRGIGLIQGLEWSDPTIAFAVAQAAFQEGLLIETCGKSGQVLKFLPSLMISESQITEGLEILERAIKKVLS